MVCLDSGRIRVLPFDELRDPETGRTEIRLVDIHSEHYRVAREYMIRLERSDLENPEMLAKLASAAKMTPEQFKARFAQAAGLEA